MPARKTTLDDLIAAAPKLRAAGVLRLRSGDFEMEFSPVEPVAPRATREDVEEDSDVLNDPHTFGDFRLNGQVPRYGNKREDG